MKLSQYNKSLTLLDKKISDVGIIRLMHNLWFIMIELPLRLVKTMVASPSKTVQTIGPSKGGMHFQTKSLSEVVSPSLLPYTANDFLQLEGSFETQSEQHPYYFQLIMLLTAIIAAGLLFQQFHKLKSKSWLSLHQEEYSTLFPRMLPNEKGTTSIEGHDKSKKTSERPTEDIDILLNEYNGYDEELEVWYGESWIDSFKDVTKIQGDSWRFKRTPDTGLPKEDLPFTRSAAISLLVWDCK